MQLTLNQATALLVAFALASTYAGYRILLWHFDLTQYALL